MGKNNGRDPSLSSQEVRSKQDSSQAFGWSTVTNRAMGTVNSLSISVASRVDFISAASNLE